MGKWKMPDEEQAEILTAEGLKEGVTVTTLGCGDFVALQHRTRREFHFSEGKLCNLIGPVNEQMDHYCKLVAVQLPYELDVLKLEARSGVRVGDRVEYCVECDDGDMERLEGTVVDVMWTEQDSDMVRWLSYIADLSAAHPITKLNGERIY